MNDLFVIFESTTHNVIKKNFDEKPTHDSQKALKANNKYFNYRKEHEFTCTLID